MKLLFALVLFLNTSLLLANPDIQHWQTANGARVYYVPAPELPMIDVRVVFDAGSARDGDKPGLAMLTNSLLDEGTATQNANQLAETFEGVGAEYGASSLRDMAVTSIRSLTEAAAMKTALDTFAAVLATPSFPKKPFQRNRKAMLLGLQQEQQEPGSLASKAFYKALYGDHPYGSHSSGSEASLKAMRREDVQAFHRQYYVARNAVIAIVGDVSRRQAEAIAEQLTTKLRVGERAADLPAVAALEKASLQRIRHDSQQTHILVGQPGMRRGDADYISLYVGNHILGGSGLVSRISDVIREQRGLAYSAYSYFAPMRENGPFTMGLQTKNAQADAALKLLGETLRDYIDKGPTEDELKRSKQNITGGWALRVDSNKKITEYVAVIGFYGLPLDYLDTFTDKVEAVTVKSIKDAFKRRIHPDKLVTVMVGGEK
nr:pitrilysin family protein [Sulfuriflexus mobilis]